MALLGKFEKDRKLSQLFVVAFFSLSLAVLMVATSLQLVAYFHTEKKALYHNQRLLAEGAGRAVSNFIRENCRTLTTAAWMTNPETTSTAQWRLYLQRLMGLQPAFRFLAVATLDGHLLALVSRYAPPASNGPDDWNIRPFKQPTDKDLEASISEVYIDPVTAEPLISIRVPVLNPLREAKLTLTAEVNLKFMWDVVYRLKVGRTGYTYVVDRKGNMLAFGDTSRVLKGENLAHVPTVAEFTSTPTNQTPSSARIYRGITGDLVVGTYVPLNTPNWAIVTELPFSEAFHDVIVAALISLFIIGGMAIIAALAGEAISRRLTVPLVALQKTATRIAQGERGLQASVEGPYEVVQLAGAFNSMAFQVEQSLGELEKRYAEVLAARDMLKVGEEQLRLAQEATRDGIWDWDLRTDQAYFSPRWYRMLDYEPDEFPASYDAWISLIHPEDRESAEEEVKQAIGSHDPFRIEIRMKAKDGGWRWIQSRGKAVAWDAQGNAVRLAGAHSDLTERKAAEEEKALLEAKLVQAQKMEAVGHLAGGIAHDFNNMLSVVIGSTELAMLDLVPDSDIYRHMAKIHGAAMRSAELVRQLLAFARKQTIQPKVLDINTTISGMLKMLHRLIGEDIDLIWKPGQPMAHIRIDPSQIDQILANLMVNARDAIDGVGTVIIETDTVDFDAAYCKAHPGFPPGRFMQLAFSDSGCGMDSQTQAKAFDPFFTTKGTGKGTGLGLSTVYGIVKQNEGFINLYSEPGKGTTFRIYLPVFESQEAVLGGEKPCETMPGGTGTVLVVEDDPAILELSQSILEQLGYTVLTAGKPEDAIQTARDYTGAIDLLITDVVMPQMNGRELGRRIEAIIPGLKCLYMSGYTANVIAQHGVLDPGINFLQKPFSLQEIATKVCEVMRQSSGSGAMDSDSHQPAEADAGQ
jgi:PAS domain S-box-containing protein